MSQKTQEEKTLKTVKPILAAVNIILIILLFTVPLLRSEAAQTGWFAKAMSVLAWLVSFGALAFEKKYRNSVPEATFYFVWFIGMGLGMLFAIIGGV